MTSATEGQGFMPDQTGRIPAYQNASTDGFPSAGERTEAFLPLGAWDAQLPADTAALAMPRKRSRAALIVALSILAALIVLAIGSFFGARWYFQDKAAPGVTFGGVSVMGKTAAELKNTVNAAVVHSTIAVSDNSGKKANASLRDLGVQVNTDTTVNNILDAKSSNDFNRLNPFSHESVALAAKPDKLAASTYLTKTFIAESDRAVPSTIAFDGNAKQFNVSPGKDGKAPVSAPVDKAVDAMIATPGQPTTVAVAYSNVTTPIPVAAAQQTADQANQRLANTITVNNGDAKSFVIPADVVASWIKTDADPSAGTIAVSYDKTAVSAYMAKDLPAQLNQQKVTQEDIVNDAGTVLATKTPGVNGVAIKNTDAVAQQVVQALDAGKPATIQAEADVTKYDTKQVKPEYRIVVDKSSQTATVYRGDTPVKTFLVCTGRSGNHETDSGNFFIDLRYASQDMRGLNDDGSHYLSPGVKWVSYFNGGEGFHTADWNYGGIASGDPSNNGSHGCVNMYEQDAQWIYDNCPEGTLVQVIGAQPSGAVR
ncbi:MULTISPECIES: L,D-transpeptidase [Bifidobacterium]|uniref:Murein L,D-transpeptidase n=1 Tax=Bifidobacterium tibiigranuli TaxID=2172043 RepID=A0A5N6RYU6_9BIFI|nr:L,D-transpeptidase [Bifidobacterium tibiigranuli]KAE8127047.1 murein L,D-transpeptidase [Bifidobacterium tibiigranuli]KAE8127756.1 murein L,D-transpeptidase [Bifidobacterium tibiigranuli]MCI1254763.1 L,D-transpeptidase [Bifidobacterium tibiigranuli]